MPFTREDAALHPHNSVVSMLTLAQATACSSPVVGASASAPLQHPAVFLTIHIGTPQKSVSHSLSTKKKKKRHALKEEKRSPDHSLQVEAAAFIRDSSISVCLKPDMPPVPVAAVTYQLIAQSQCKPLGCKSLMNHVQCALSCSLPMFIHAHLKGLCSFSVSIYMLLVSDF